MHYLGLNPPQTPNPKQPLHKTASSLSLTVLSLCVGAPPMIAATPTDKIRMELLTRAGTRSPPGLRLGSSNGDTWYTEQCVQTLLNSKHAHVKKTILKMHNQNEWEWGDPSSFYAWWASPSPRPHQSLCCHLATRPHLANLICLLSDFMECFYPKCELSAPSPTLFIF